jgi:DNA mismatch repair ATPase MutS
MFSLITVAMLIWWLSTDLTDPNARLGVVAICAVEGLFALSMRTKILGIVHSVEEPARDLELLSGILAILEQQQFRCPLLAALRKAIDVNGRAASHRIARLRRMIELLDSRDNPFVRAFGPLLLWTTQVGMAIESWRAENGSHVAGWLDAVSEMEALSSLANYAWEHADDPFPQFTEAGSGPFFDGEDMGHPLLADAHCVRNGVRIAAPLRLLVVSGSNMSGKSTLLRAIGVNTVLALAGAPVRARRLTLSHLSLGASIRTTDSLEEGHSRFMAEILRLKQVLELPPPALFLLDELLHGTNSHDRALGSEGLIRALLKRGAIGLVTTHDLALSRIADEIAPAAANVHFEDRLEKGRLVFDYRLRTGVVERSNALDLMRAVGLDV